MEKIIVDSELIESKAKKISEIADEFEANIKSYNELANSLTDSWSGKDQHVYFDYVEQVNIPALNTLLRAIRTYSDYLNQVPKTYETLDDSFKTKKIEI